MNSYIGLPNQTPQDHSTEVFIQKSGISACLYHRMKKMIKRAILCLWGFLFVLNITAQNNDIGFYSEIEPDMDIHVGQEFYVSYLADAPIYQMDTPQWDKTIEVIKVTPIRTSRTLTIHNDEKVEKSLAGKRYTLKVHKPGKITIPSVSANIGGEACTCKSQTIKILPPRKMKNIHCSFSTNPKEILRGTKFYLTLSCDYRPDGAPAIQAQGLRLLATSVGSTTTNGKTVFQYTYVMAAIQTGEFTVTPVNLSFNGATYQIEPYTIRVRSQSMFQEI